MNVNDTSQIRFGCWLCKNALAEVILTL